MKFSQILKEKRKNSQLTQEQLAEKIFVSTKTISNWENEKTTPDLESLIHLSELFQLSLDDLIKGDKEMTKNIDKKIKRGEIFGVIVLLPILLIGLPIIYKLIPNNLTSSLLFFGYIFIVFTAAILLVIFSLRSIIKSYKK